MAIDYNENIYCCILFDTFVIVIALVTSKPCRKSAQHCFRCGFSCFLLKLLLLPPNFRSSARPAHFPAHFPHFRDMHQVTNKMTNSSSLCWCAAVAFVCVCVCRMCVCRINSCMAKYANKVAELLATRQRRSCAESTPTEAMAEAAATTSSLKGHSQFAICISTQSGCVFVHVCASVCEFVWQCECEYPVNCHSDIRLFSYAFFVLIRNEIELFA